MARSHSCGVRGPTGSIEKINLMDVMQAMETKKSVSAADLYVLLTRELKRRQATPCGSCFIQLPYRVDSRERGAGNWELPMPPDCGGECRGIIEDLYAEFSRLYELQVESYSRQ